MNVFTGRKYLVFERYPDYKTGGKNPSLKVKTLIDLGFTKLVLRIKATGYTKKAIRLAELAFPYVSENLARNINDKSTEFSKADGVGFQRRYCYNYGGELMGAIEDFRHWYKHDIVCFSGCPRGVLYARNLDKYFGFSHRGMASFGNGDKLFDEAWEATWDDLKIEWVQKYCKSVGYRKIPKSIEEAMTFVKLNDIKSEKNIVEHIPFNFRGGKTITTKEQAITAARNFSLYLS